MRLINIHTLELEEFFSPPPYAILSHRWIGREITYEQFMNPSQRKGPGYEKIASFCRLLQQHPDYLPTHIEWAWIDTCCIDKRSSAELSESINSMWQWYWHAEYCIAWLHDVHSSDEDSLRMSEWFTRGWTLQEMLAPVEVYICDSQWRCIGTRTSLSDALSLVSGVPAEFLRDNGRQRVHWTSMAKRMSWASRRKTTRPEDEAYCLFGLFGVNLPLLYGEGTYAFIRLQEEIIRRFDDESILAWKSTPYVSYATGFLASSPARFELCGGIDQAHPDRKRQTFRVTNRGVEMSASLLQLRHSGIAISGGEPSDDDGEPLTLGLFLEINCVDTVRRGGPQGLRCALALIRRNDGSFSRDTSGSTDSIVDESDGAGDFERLAESTVYLRKDDYNHYYGGNFGSRSLASVPESSWTVL
ncbi:hypothetical protein M409DRAFT_20790 [Zasmidium cellare ATCC 36951]|uniref:Uncharacterized protein n=1 Tax=Zasmidium cellare ATCC 36951 TaxID=1080233 RepID=A0A6A6CQ19_ZASCE|nr:uncharacterized protein M409DRAFT_20790 [Zasmidium cellare ATCC 36951]KAF2168773.1 hypothetical protein M409DRAFT_20790 [Zasmidium cellare ATCC 36951]